MPKKEINDYTFYKIVNVNGDCEMCYVGSTVNMIQRTRTHKYNCNNPNSRQQNLKLYKTIREHGGWDEFKIIPIGTAEHLTLTESRVIEEKYRIELCAELNSWRCIRTSEEDKEHRRLYRENNKEAITKRLKVWYKDNKEVITEKHKVYYKKNKDKLNELASVKITCECGCEARRGDILRHRKTKKHIDLMNNKNNIDVIHNE